MYANDTKLLYSYQTEPTLAFADALAKRNVKKLYDRLNKATVVLYENLYSKNIIWRLYNYHDNGCDESLVLGIIMHTVQLAEQGQELLA